MDPTCVLNFFTFFERKLYKSNCIIFIFSWFVTHTKVRSKLVVIATAGSQKITLWGPQRTPLGILRFNACCVQQMSPADTWRQSMSWLFSRRTLFGVRCTCTSFQRCFLNLCSGSALFSCLLFQQLCHLFNKDNRRLYPDDCTRLLYGSFGFFCFWLLACTAS